MEKQQNLTKFNDSLNAFFLSRLVIVDKTISDFLKMLVNEPSFMELVKESARTTSFKQEYQNSIVNDENGLSFKLPMNKRHIVALVVGLLFEFDKMDISVIDFVRKFYPREQSHDSYLAFCDGVIRPFGEAFRSLYLGEVDDNLPSSESIVVENKPFNEKAKEEIDYWLNLIMGGMIGDYTYSKDEQKELRTLIQGMSYVCSLADPLLIKLTWIGLKNTLGNHKSIYRELKEVESILITYGVID